MASIKIDITGDNTNFLNSVSEAAKGVNDAAKSINESGQKIDDMFDDVSQHAGKSLKELKSEMKDLEKGLKDCNETLEKFGENVDFSKMEAQIERTRRTIENLKAQGATDGGMDGFSAQLRQAEENLQTYTERLEDARRTEARLLNDQANYKAEIKDLQTAIDGYSTKTKKASQDTKEFKDAQKEATSSSSELKGMLSTIGKLSGGYLTVKGIQKFVEKVTEAREGLEMLEIQMEGLMGEKGGEIFENIKGMAYDSGVYSTQALAGAVQQMNIYGVETENIIPLLKEFEDVAMGNDRTLQQLAISFGRLEQQGNLTSISMRSMLRAGFNPLEEISRTTGKSMSMLNEELKKGQITADMVKDALKSATSEGGKFYQMNEKVSESLKAEKGRLQMAYSKMFAEIGEGYDSTIKEGYRFAQSVVEHYKEIGAAMGTLIATYGTYKTATIALAAAETALNAHYVTKIRLLRAAVVAQQMLNTAMMFNPVALVAAAIAGLTVAVIAFSKESSVAADRQKEWADRDSEHAEELENKRQKLNELLSTINDETKGEYDRQDALDELKRLLPSVFSKYDTWIDLQKQLSNATAEANQQLAYQNRLQNAQSDRKQDTQELKDWKRMRELNAKFIMNQEENKEWVGLLSKYKSKFKSKGTFQTYDKFIGQQIKELEGRVSKDVDNISNAVGEAWNRGLSNYTSEQSSRAISHYQGLLKKLDASKTIKKVSEDGKTVSEALNPNYKDFVKYNGVLITREEILRRIDALDKHRNLLNNNKNRDYIGEAKAAVEQAKADVRAVQANQSKYESALQYEKALSDAKKTLKDKEAILASRTDSKLEKADEAARKKKEREDAKSAKAGQRLAKENATFREKVAEEERRWGEKKSKQAYDLAKAESDARIAGLEEGFEKEMALIEQSYNSESDTIAQKIEQFRKDNYEHYKKLHDANPDNKDESFSDIHDISDKEFDLTENQLKEIDALRDAMDKKHSKRVVEAYDSEIQKMYDFLKQYGSFEEKRFAISEEYAKKIAKARGAEKLALQQEYDTKMAEISVDNLMENIDFASVFSDFGLLLSEPLKQTVDELKRLTQTPQFKNRSFDEQKAVYEAIEKAQSSLGGISALNFTEIGTNVVAYNAALNERMSIESQLAESSKQMAEAYEKLTKAQATGKQSAIELAQAEYDEAVAKNNSLREDYAEANARVAKTQAAATTSLNNFNSTLKKVEDSIRKIYSGNGVLGALWNLLGKDLQNIIGGFVSGGAELTKQYGKMTEALTKGGKTIDQFASNFQNQFNQLASTFTDETTVEQASEAINGLIDRVFKDMFGDENGFDKVSGELGNLIGDLLTKATKDGADSASAAQALGNTLGELFKAIGAAGASSGNLWGAIIGTVLQLLDEFAENGLGRFVETLLENIGEAISGIIGNLLRDFIPQLVKGVGQLIQGVIEGVLNLVSFGAIGSINEWFSGSNAKEVQEKTEELTKSNETLKESIDKLKDTIDRVNGGDAITDYQRAIRAQEKVNKQQAEILDAQMGYHSAHHSNAYYWNLQNTDYARVNRVLREYAEREGKKASAVYSLQDIIKLSPEELDYIRTYYTEIWQMFLDQGKYDKSEYWNALADEAGKIQELTDSINANLTQTSFDSMRDSFVSSLMDMDKEASDFADDFEEYMMKALLNFAVGERLDENLKKWYTQWAETMQKQNGELTANQIETYRQQWQNFVNQGIQMRDQIAEITGYGSSDSSYSQEASKKGFASMSQDAAEELNGRFTALQIAGENVSNQMIAAVALLSAISSFGGEQSNIMSEIRDQLAFANSYLEDMVNYSKKIYIQFGEKIDKIVDQTKNI